MNDAEKNSFLAAVPEGARRDRAARDLQTVLNAREVGSILNVVFQDAKRTLDAEAEGMFKRATGHFTAGKGGKLDPDFAINALLNEMSWAILFSGARTAIAASKKLAAKKLDFSHPMVDAYRAAVALILPVALLLEEVKGLVVKGRRPPTAEVAAARAAKLASVEKMDRATCGCCFGGQAVLDNGYIHDHGYRKPAPWRKTASCPGSMFRPLEVSDEGPRYMVAMLTSHEAHLVEELKGTDTLESITFERRGEKVTVGLGSVEFASRLAALIEGLNRDLRFVREELAEFTKVVANWKAA